MARKFATRHRCSLRVSHQCSRGTGKGPEKCRTCKGVMVRQIGLYGVFVWRGDGRYPEADALSMHRTEGAADKACEANESYVSRWLTLDA